jgi:HPt (histidine-containing phosphotransfer) domain-containing protein
MLSMIDQHVVKAQFSAFPAEICAKLLSAAEADITSWSDKLVAAWEAGDGDAAGHARHALKGLCGNFGATKLLAMVEEDLSLPEDRAALLSLRESTLSAIRVVALDTTSRSAQ